MYSRTAFSFNHRWTLSFLMLTSLAVETCPTSFAQTRVDPYQWAKNSHVVAHALGGVEKKTFLNAREAFTASYAKGSRVFEMDLLMAKDSRLVGLHTWSPFMMNYLQINYKTGDKLPLPSTQFLNSRILGKMTPLEIRDVIGLLGSYPDAVLITDTKVTTGTAVAAAFSQIVAEAKAVNPAILDRIVPQIYRQTMLPTLKAIYPFKSMIYALYLSKDTDDQVLQFIKSSGIQGVSMPASRATPLFLSSLKNLGVYTYIHTINTTDDYNRYRQVGAWGVYSDFLSPGDILNKPPGRAATHAWTIDLPYVQ